VRGAPANMSAEESSANVELRVCKPTPVAVLVVLLAVRDPAPGGRP
jgi:hypothetical protein